MSNRQFDEYIKSLVEEENLEIPASVRERTEQTLASLPVRIPKRKTHIMRSITAVAACMAILFLGVMPNLSTAYATAAQGIPVIGDLVRVFTIRNYFYEDDRHEMDAEIPSVNDPESSEASNLINKDIEELTKAVISQFYKELAASSGKGYGSVYIDYEILTNSEQWFTLKLTISELMGSSDTSTKYYHIDRTKGVGVVFGDLFQAKTYAYLEELIVSQMKAQMTKDDSISYWIEDSVIGENFIDLDAEQNFYFMEDGSLVIVFDKYEVGPGSMGCPEFVISYAEYSDKITPHYAEIFRPN